MSSSEAIRRIINDTAIYIKNQTAATKSLTQISIDPELDEHYLAMLDHYIILSYLLGQLLENVFLMEDEIERGVAIKDRVYGLEEE